MGRPRPRGSARLRVPPAPAPVRRCPASTSASSPTARSGRTPMIEALSSSSRGVVTGAAVGAALRPRRRRRDRGRAAGAGSCCPSSGRDLAPRVRRRPAPRPRRGRDAHARLPRAGPADAAARRAAAARSAHGFELARGHRAARRAAGVPVDARIIRGRTFRDALRGCSTPSARPDRRRRRERATASAPTTSPGCSSTRPGEVAVVRPADESVLDGQHRVVQAQERPAPQPQRMVGV